MTENTDPTAEERERMARELYRALHPGDINTPDSDRTPESDAEERERAYSIWDAGREGYSPGRECRMAADRLRAAGFGDVSAERERADKAREEAWDECARALNYDETAHTAQVHNPYRAALTEDQPAATPEPPKLDPEPWVGRVTGHRYSAGKGDPGIDRFAPRPEFEQDPAKYEVQS